MLDKFALVAVAGELASKFGITGWKSGEAWKACQKCFRDLIESRGGVGAGDMERAIKKVVGFIESHQASRFVRQDGKDNRPSIPNLAGWIGEERDTQHQQRKTFYLQPSVMETEILASHDIQGTVKEMARRGQLRFADGRFTHQRRLSLPGEKKAERRRVYVVYTSSIGEETDDADAT